MKTISKRRGIRTTLMAACAGFAISLASLAWADPAWADPASNSLNVAFSGEVTTLDMYKESSREGTALSRMIFDGLLFKDLNTGEIKPELAESYTVVDPVTVDFVIRKNVKFHDGSTLTPQDVAYTLNLVSSDDYSVRYSIAVDWIKNAEVLEDGTVRVHMHQPYPLSLEMLAGNVPIYPEAYYRKVGTEGMAVAPIGTGPFKLASMVPGTNFVLERFEDYYRESPKGFPAIEKLNFQVIPEPNTQYAALMNGQIDWIWRLPTRDAENLSKNPNIAINNVSGVRFAYLAMNPHFNNGNSPLADARVRKAVNMAINRELIVERLIGGASEPIEAPCSPIQFGCYPGLVKYPYNPDRARELLAEAGYADGFSLEMYVASMPANQAQVIADNLGQIGIKVSVNIQQYGTVSTAWREGRAPLVLTNLGSFGIADVGIGAAQYFGGGADDTAKDEEAIKLFQAADRITDRNERGEVLRKAIERITDEAFWAPLWTYNIITANNKDLKFTLTPDEYPRFYTAEWNK